MVAGCAPLTRTRKTRTPGKRCTKESTLKGVTEGPLPSTRMNATPSGADIHDLGPLQGPILGCNAFRGCASCEHVRSVRGPHPRLPSTTPSVSPNDQTQVRHDAVVPP